MKRTMWLILALILAPLNGLVLGQRLPGQTHPASLRYLSPPDGSQFVPPGTTLALRLDGPIDPPTLSATQFELVGAASGTHFGRVQVADDDETVVFSPSQPFRPGEQVAVTIKPGLATRAGAVFAGLRAGFSISAGGADLAAVQKLVMDENEAALPTTDPAARSASAPAATNEHPQDDVTFPDNFPYYAVSVPATNTAPGLLFLAPFRQLQSSGNFLFITSDTGEPVFWQETSQAAIDFKRQPDGTLTYYDFATVRFRVLDSTYTQIKTIAAANGYLTDLHELQILPNGHALFMIYDPQVTNTVQYGGYQTATVTGLIIQELDTGGLPVFQWDSWSHFTIPDTYVALNTPMVDYVHGNAIALDQDGNLLLSSRHMSEITKISHGNGPDYGDGHILWRLGGKHNQFTFHNDPGKFYFQHDIRRLANGHLTIFDNENLTHNSRAVEYQIDENAKVITNTWQYQNNPAIDGFAMGDTQRLPDGHTLIGWGFGHPNVTEVLTNGTKLFELTLDGAFQSYRALRLPWSAVPAWAPTLVLTGATPTLYYSWNGATDVASYEIYGGFGGPQWLWTTQARTGFEDRTALTNAPAGYCAFRVRPINHLGQRQAFSNVVTSSQPCIAFARFMPLILGP